MPPSPAGEFRRRTVELLRRSGIPLTDIAAELGIEESQLRAWLDAAADGRTSGCEQVQCDGTDELARLRNRNRQLETENAILKQVAAYLARQHPSP